jgi:ketosteroid isomerase-like protein
MTEQERSNQALIRDYLTALEHGQVGEALGRFFTEDAEQVEWPNRLNPHGGRSDRATLLARSEQGRHVLSSQRYEVESELARGEGVAVEASWVGTLATPLGSLAPGDAMRAHFAMFFECRDGRIARQRNYDCFEPW